MIAIAKVINSHSAAMKIDLKQLRAMASEFLDNSAKNGCVGCGMPVHPYVIAAMIDRIEAAESEIEYLKSLHTV